MELNFDINKPLEMITDKLTTWFDLFVSMLPNMAVALILLIVFIALAKLGSKVFEKVLAKHQKMMHFKPSFLPLFIALF